MAGPPISGIADVLRAIADLERRVRRIENARERTVSFGDNYRVEVRGDGLTSELHAIRTSDGNDKLLAP